MNYLLPYGERENGKVDIVKMAQLSSTKCDVCPKEPGIGKLYCYDCEQHLCNDCRIFHDKFPSNKKHKIIDSHTVGRGVFKSKPVCEIHTENLLHYCEECDCLICNECLKCNHNCHRIGDIKKAESIYRKQCDDVIEKLKTKITIIEDSLSKIRSKILPQIISDSEEYIQTILSTEKDFHKIVDQVTKIEKTTASDYQVLESEKYQSFQGILERLLDKCAETCLRYTNIIDEKHELIFICEVKEIQKDVDRLDDIPEIPEQNRMRKLEPEKLADMVIKDIQKYSTSKHLADQLKHLQEENEKLRNRLGQIYGSNLTADFCDPNRPWQLGEKFSDLYLNEWTDAMKELGNENTKVGERTNITILRIIVEKSYEFAKTRAADYVKGLEEVLEALFKVNNSVRITPEISKLIKDHRWNTAMVVAYSLYHTFLSAHTEYNIGGDGVKKFIQKTVTICWLMAVQVPPVILTTKISGKFDTDRIQHYTKSGSTVDYVVWPIVFLHEGGPIICKGVVQGK